MTLSLSISILYEDDDVLVIDKPSGLVVNRAQSVKGETVQDWAEKKLRITNYELRIKDDKTTLTIRNFLDRSGVAHRLDKETSGILLIAKHPDALENLLSQFKNREVEKEYTALVHGDVVPKTGTIRAPIGRLSWRHGLFGVMPGGKHAVTHYNVSQNYTREKEVYSLLNLKIETGRAHQIRVHLQYIGHPIVGDAFYAGRKRSRQARTWCPRVFLHASNMRFKQPMSGEWITLESKIPSQLREVLDMLQKT